MTIYDILKDTSYKAEQFSSEAIERLNTRLIEKEDKNGKKYAVVNCLVRKKISVSIPKKLFVNCLSISSLTIMGIPFHA